MAIERCQRSDLSNVQPTGNDFLRKTSLDFSCSYGRRLEGSISNVQTRHRPQTPRKTPWESPLSPWRFYFSQALTLAGQALCFRGNQPFPGRKNSMSETTPYEPTSLEQLNALETRMTGSTNEHNEHGTAHDNDGLPELPERTAPGLLRFMPPLIQEFWAKKAYFNMDQDGAIAMDGFYKNGPLRLDVKPDGSVVAIDKRGRETPIKSFDDLVTLNYFWWKQSNTKTSYVVPQRPWIDSFTEKKLVKRKVIYLPIDEEEGSEEA